MNRSAASPLASLVHFPERIANEAELDRLLTEPSPALVESIRAVASPLLIVGAGGKMGPTLAVLAHRAALAAGHRLEVIAASRFSDPAAQARIEEQGVRTFGVDLLEPSSVANLPDARNIISLVGQKFGTAENPDHTWKVNTVAPANLLVRFPSARVVALSTGNVYPLVPVASGGATEDTPLTPLGEYAKSAVAREEVYRFGAQKHGAPLAIVRLNYAVELRYGVLIDIALKIWNGLPVDVSNGWFNCIWQGEACERILRCLALAAVPPEAFNLCCPQAISVREVAAQLGAAMDRPVAFTGTEGATALLSHPGKLEARLGPLRTPLAQMIHWTADWVQRGGRTLSRPTHFEVRDGRY